MEYRFNAEEWQTISKQERIRRCRLMGAEAHKLAEKATGTMRMTYLQIEQDWERLAFEIEQNSN